jgi:hypothetical protein
MHDRRVLSSASLRCGHGLPAEQASNQPQLEPGSSGAAPGTRDAYHLRRMSGLFRA